MHRYVSVVLSSIWLIACSSHRVVDFDSTTQYPVKRVNIEAGGSNQFPAFIGELEISIRCSKGAVECRVKYESNPHQECWPYTVCRVHARLGSTAVDRQRLDVLVVALRESAAISPTLEGLHLPLSDAEKMIRKSPDYDKLSPKQRALLDDTLGSAPKLEAVLKNGFDKQVEENEIPSIPPELNGWVSVTVTFVDGSAISATSENPRGFEEVPWARAPANDKTYSGDIAIALERILSAYPLPADNFLLHRLRQITAATDFFETVKAGLPEQ